MESNNDCALLTTLFKIFSVKKYGSFEIKFLSERFINSFITILLKFIIQKYKLSDV